jgi:hypothetical protein
MPKLDNSKHEKFAQLVAMEEHTVAEAYCAIYNTRGKTAELNSARLAKTAPVALRIEELRALRSQPPGPAQQRFLTLDQKREFLARVVNTPAGEIDESSPLCQAADFAESASGSSRKLRMPDKLRALELDAKLAGELRERHELDLIDSRASVLELQQRLDAAAPLLAARQIKEAK